MTVYEAGNNHVFIFLTFMLFMTVNAFLSVGSHFFFIIRSRVFTDNNVDVFMRAWIYCAHKC